MERRTVGFDYRVTLEEMEFVAYQDLSRPRRELLPLVREFVGRDGAGMTTQQSTASILLNIWHGHAQESKAVSRLRDRARRMLTEIDVGERRALHWGMALLVYPFFQAFARQVGVALELEREVDVRRINRSIKRLYGDRRKVEVACKAVISSMREWGALSMIRHGVYVPMEPLPIGHPDLRLWLAEAVIHASQAEMVPLEMINQAPEWFPFSINLSLLDLKKSKRLEAERQGLDLIMVGCR